MYTTTLLRNLNKTNFIRCVLSKNNYGVTTTSVLLEPLLVSDNNNNNILSSSSITRYYVTRAHPKPISEYALPDAIKMILDNIEQRRQKKIRRNEKVEEYQKNPNASKIQKQQIIRKQPDETIELVINLNLDPRKPGQALRGNITLPHGTGKKSDDINVIVFTDDVSLQEQAIQYGALHAGGNNLIEQISNGDIPVDSFQVALALDNDESNIMSTVTKKVARILGPRGLMPNKKVGTLLDNKQELLNMIQKQLSGNEITYRTEKEGIVHVPVGKGSFGTNKLLDNIGSVMNEIVINAKPEKYGKGKSSSGGGGKKKKSSQQQQPKYLLKASLSSTQGPGIRIDLRTIDPSSTFFLKTLSDDNTTKKNTDDTTNEQVVAA